MTTDVAAQDPLGRTPVAAVPDQRAFVAPTQTGISRAPDTPHVVFVDDESMVLSGLRRALSRFRRGWLLDFLDDPAQAAELVARAAQTDRPVDVVVTDYRMPDMDGLQLLEHVQRTSPSTARVILSGQTDGDLLLSSLRPTHMFLAKPCDVEALVAVLDRLVRVRGLVADPDLRDVLGGLVALPKAPQSVIDLQRLGVDPDATVHDVAGVVERDVALTAEILKLTNSAFFSLGRTVESAERAVALLGLQTVLGLAASGALLEEPRGVPAGRNNAGEPGTGSPDTLRRGLSAVRRRAIASAGVVREVARASGWTSERSADAVLVAMLHDVGLLALAGVNPDGVIDLLADPDADRPSRQTQLLGCPVAQASALLMTTWGFSDHIVDLLLALAAEDPASPDPDGDPVTAVMFARSVTATGAPVAESGAPTNPAFPPSWLQIAADVSSRMTTGTSSEAAGPPRGTAGP